MSAIASPGTRAWSACSGRFIPKPLHVARRGLLPKAAAWRCRWPTPKASHSTGVHLFGRRSILPSGERLMTVRLALIFAATTLVSVSALAQAGASQTPSPEAKAQVESCEAHKFETTVKLMTAEGKVRSSKVRLCGVEGQTDAQWAATLKDAVRK